MEKMAMARLKTNHAKNPSVSLTRMDTDGRSLSARWASPAISSHEGSDSVLGELIVYVYNTVPDL